MRLGTVCGAEFAIFSADMSWTMLHTHEDHVYDGPYFMRREWISNCPTTEIRASLAARWNSGIC